MPNKHIKIVIFSLISSFLILIMGVLAYSYSLYKFAALFDSLRQGKYLVFALYISPFILICALLFSVLFMAISVITYVPSLRCFGSFAAYSCAPVLLVVILGIVIGSFISGPGPVSVPVFIADIAYLSIIYSLTAIAWFLWILPSTIIAFWLECSEPSTNGRIIYKYAKRLWGFIIARWLLSLLVAGLAALVLRTILIHLGIGAYYVVTARTSDWTLNKLLNDYLPRTASLIVAPIWVTVLVYVYARLIDGRIKRLSR